jgi:hypothetical protein
VPLSFMNAMMSSSRLSGRLGRTGGGPARAVNEKVAGHTGIGSLKNGRGVGREMDTIRHWDLPSEERELRAEDRGVMVDCRDFGGTRLTGSCGTGVGSECASELLLRKRREPATYDQRQV